MTEKLEKAIFEIDCIETFNELCLKVFRFQYETNKVYRIWCENLGKNFQNIGCKEDIPFLPISFFKTQKVLCQTPHYIYDREYEFFFRSSGTTQTGNSIHYVKSSDLYLKSLRYNFSLYFGKPNNWCFLAILPSYSSNEHSSLIFMMNDLIALSHYENSGFYNQDLDSLIDMLLSNERNGIPTILFGVTYALLDILERQSFDLQYTIVFETGGMKGRRAEIPKEELHKLICEGFGIESVASEYGMCELMSQAYSLKDGLFNTPPQMDILIRDVNDPMTLTTNIKGAINVIDLANLYSCSFIATDDVGEKQSDRSFLLTGRLDNSDIRGCNLLYL
jgi:hypothetical protein